jgi:hypothetical protein
MPIVFITTDSSQFLKGGMPCHYNVFLRKNPAGVIIRAVGTAGFGNGHLYRPFLANDPPGKRIVFVSSWKQKWYISGNPVQILQAGQALPGKRDAAIRTTERVGL